MKTVKVQQAKTHLSAILTEVEEGQEYVIARADRPVVRLVTIEYDDNMYPQYLHGRLVQNRV